MPPGARRLEAKQSVAAQVAPAALSAAEQARRARRKRCSPRTSGSCPGADAAIAELQGFHHRLSQVRVLDPACGLGNFLYVTLEHLKRLEGEVLDAMHRLGHGQALLETSGITVDPHQLLGLEVNPRTATITEMVLWIRYLQWHFCTRGRRTGSTPDPAPRPPARRVP